MNVDFTGRFYWELLENGKRLVWGTIKNGITETGFNTMLDDEFASGWSVGLIDNSGFTALASTDTMSSHSGWTEFTSYSEATRQTWTPSAASGGILINASAISFSISASGTLKGMFVADDSTKGGTSGLLWSTAAFLTNQSVFAGQTFRLYYKLTAREG